MGEERRITDLTEISAFRANDYIAVDNASEAQTKKLPATAITGPIADVQTDLENTMDLIRGDDDEYSSLKSYKVGQYVVVKPPLVAEETIYKCISPCSPGSWAINQSYFEAKTLTEAVTDLNNELSNQQNNFGTEINIPLDTDYSVTNDKGGLVIYGGYADTLAYLNVNTVKVNSVDGGSQAAATLVSSFRVNKGDVVKIVSVRGTVIRHVFLPIV